MRKNLTGELIAEFIGTALLVFLGNFVVATAILYGAYQGQWQPSILWGITVATIVYAVGSVSGAHINPAVTLANALFRQMPWSKAIAYMVTQVIGGFAGAALLHALIAPVLSAQGLNETTARIFSTFPGEGLPNGNAFLIEIMLTFFLVTVILAINDPKNAGAPKAGMGAVIVGITVALLVGIGGPWTMASLNPARDLGPRLWMAVAGFGEIPFSGSNGYWWVPIFGPLVGGGVLAGLVYDQLISRFIPTSAEEQEKKAA